MVEWERRRRGDHCFQIFRIFNKASSHVDWLKIKLSQKVSKQLLINPEINYLSTGADEAWTLGQDVRC